MKIIYVHNSIFDKPAANKHQVVNMCNSFTKYAEVTLITAASSKKVMKQYKLNSKVKLILTKPITNYYLRSIKLARIANKQNPDYVYTRDLFTALRSKAKTIYEVHHIPNSKLWKILFKRVRKKVYLLVMISNGLAEYLGKDKKTVILGDAVNLQQFDPKLTTTAARKKLKLPKGKLVCYIGNTDYAHDMKTLIQAFKQMPKINLAIFGKEQEYFKKLPKNIHHKGYTATPELVCNAADALFAGYTKHVLHIAYMSPLKLFEYAACKKPIIVANFPRTKEVFNEKEAFFYTAERVESLKKAVKQALTAELGAKTANNAYLKVKDNTWDARAKHIVELLRTSVHKV